MFPIIAGSDTTANAIKMIVSHLAANPRVGSILQKEIRKASLGGVLSCPATNEETARLLYLQAVIWEGLRVHPPFGGLIMKEVGPGGDTFDGKYIPAGTRIGHSIWAVTHDPSVFGHDVDVFRPERWLEADENTRSLMKKNTELVFGSGRWGCPGRTVAFIELNKVLVEVRSMLIICPPVNESVETNFASSYSADLTLGFSTTRKFQAKSNTRPL